MKYTAIISEHLLRWPPLLGYLLLILHGFLPWQRAREVASSRRTGRALILSAIQPRMRITQPSNPSPSISRGERSGKWQIEFMSSVASESDETMPANWTGQVIWVEVEEIFAWCRAPTSSNFPLPSDYCCFMPLNQTKGLMNSRSIFTGMSVEEGLNLQPFCLKYVTISLNPISTLPYA